MHAYMCIGHSPPQVMVWAREVLAMLQVLVLGLEGVSCMHAMLFSPTFKRLHAIGLLYLHAAEHARIAGLAVMRSPHNMAVGAELLHDAWRFLSTMGT